MALSRMEENSVGRVLDSNSPGSPVTGYCLAHLAAATNVRRERRTDLATYVRALAGAGECEVQLGGFCNAGQHFVSEIVIWGPVHFLAERVP